MGGGQCEATEERCSVTAMSEHSLEDVLERDTSNLFSDPESEWTGTFKMEEPEEDQKDDLDNLRPESDHNQPDHLYKNLYTIPSLTYDF